VQRFLFCDKAALPFPFFHWTAAQPRTTLRRGARRQSTVRTKRGCAPVTNAGIYLFDCCTKTLSSPYFVCGPQHLHPPLFTSAMSSALFPSLVHEREGGPWSAFFLQTRLTAQSVESHASSRHADSEVSFPALSAAGHIVRQLKGGAC
jgi:hypothetical protein